MTALLALSVTALTAEHAQTVVVCVTSLLAQLLLFVQTPAQILHITPVSHLCLCGRTCIT